jgi:phospholipid N-methyltransferase
MQGMPQRWADYRVFWRQFRQAYHTTGAVLPSGPALAKALCRYVANADNPVDESLRDSKLAVSERLPYVARRILEVGPGTGAVTGRIISDLPPADRLVLVERNEQFAARLRTRLIDDPLFSRAADRITLMHAGVEELAEDEPFDLIISGLPLNNFSVELVEQILAKLRRLLAPGGTLSYFEYVAVRKAKSLVSSRRERDRLRGIGRVTEQMLHGHEIHRDLVLANVPPAWVHHVRFKAGSTEQGAGSKKSGSLPRAPGPLPS